jgi:SAM-dependent methyltransferase
LEEASRKAARYQERVLWLWKDGLDLPFDDATFDGVSCLEALEFLADASGALREMARVLRPGGTMLTSNRIGIDALMMPGRVFPKERLRTLLTDLSFDAVSFSPWQTYYDLVWATKEGALSAREGSWTLREVLRCPSCRRSTLAARSASYVCQSCGATYGVERGIVRLEVPLSGRSARKTTDSRIPRVV